ncbi:MAG TPA: C45 family peptidase [Burkholderiaceae bacterium]|nr:C45 family peptidase [Burkholderiaceae bacterium]
MAIQVTFATLLEERPGAAWQAVFERLWPGYRAWFLRSGTVDRPSYLQCRRALREHMPELVPTWERLVELAGGGDLEARFLSLWCPPRYITGCSQAVWLDPAGAAEPALLRNYDFAPALLEGNWLATNWLGPRVVAMGDCLWGALDGINEAGLAASLSFGGRTVSGAGFGIPLVLRYLLEVAQNTAEAIALLQRVPVSMSYTVTLLDARAEWATVFVAPDRAVEVTRHRAVTNFQHRVEWPEHARATRAQERLACLQQQMDAAAPLPAAIDALLQPPLFQSAWLRGYGTLYSAVYRPRSGGVELLWPGERWAQSVDDFEEGRREIVYAPGGYALAGQEDHAVMQVLAESRR